MSNMFNADAEQTALIYIAIAFYFSVSHFARMFFYIIWNMRGGMQLWLAWVYIFDSMHNALKLHSTWYSFWSSFNSTPSAPLMLVGIFPPHYRPSQLFSPCFRYGWICLWQWCLQISPLWHIHYQYSGGDGLGSFELLAAPPCLPLFIDFLGSLSWHSEWVLPHINPIGHSVFSVILRQILILNWSLPAWF